MEATQKPGEGPRLQLCANCDLTNAVVWCSDCKGGLCESCELAHRRVSLTRNHQLHKQPTEAKTRSQSRACTQHPSELLELVCLTCKTLTCRDCQLTAHMNHSFQFVSQSIVNVKKTVTEAVQPIRAQFDTVSQSLRDMETRLKFIEKSKSHLKTDLLNFFSILAENLQKRMKDIYNEIVANCKLERDRIFSRMKTLKELQRNQTEILEFSKTCQSANEFLTVLVHWKKIKQRLNVVQGQDLSAPSAMSHFLVWTHKDTVEMLEKMVFLEAEWIPFAVPQEDSSMDHETPSEAVTTLSPSETGSSSSSFTTSSSSSRHVSSHVLHSNNLGCPTDVIKDSSILIGETGCSSTTTPPASNKSLPLASSSSNVFQPNPVVQTGSPKTNPSHSGNPSNYNLLSPTINTPYLSSHSVTTNQTSLSNNFAAHVQPVPEAGPPTASSLSITTPNTTVSRMKNPQPVKPNHNPNLTAVVNLLKSSSSTTSTTTASISKQKRFPIISHLLEGSDTSASQLPPPNIVKAPTGLSSNIAHVPLATNQSVQIKMVPAPYIPKTPGVASFNVPRPPSAPIQLTVLVPKGHLQNFMQRPMLQNPNFVQDTRVLSPNVPPGFSTLNVVQTLSSPSSIIVDVPQFSSSDIIQASQSPLPSYSEAAGLQGPKVMASMVLKPPLSQGSTVSSANFVNTSSSTCANVAHVPNLIQASNLTSQSFTQPLMNSCPVFVGAASLQIPNVQTSSSNGISAPMILSPNVNQAPSQSSADVLIVHNQTSLKANEIPNSSLVPTSGVLLTPTANPSSVGASLTNLSSLTGSCPASTLCQTQMLANTAAPPSSDHASFILTDAQTFPSAFSDVTGGGPLLDPVSLDSQAITCNLHQDDAADNEPTTTVSDEPKTREITTKVMAESGTADNEPTSTVPEDPELDKMEPTTTTSEEHEQITSTADLGVDEHSTCETSEPCKASDHHDVKMKVLNPRVSLLRIPVCDHKPGRPLPSFRVVVGESNDQIYLEEIEESETLCPPIDNAFSDFVDLTLSPEAMDQCCVIMDPITDCPVQDAVDTMEPLIIPESPISLEILSCSVCMSPESLIICSLCARGFHRTCHVPEVTSHSMLNWNCSLCQDKSEPFCSERPEPPQDGLSIEDQRRCETLLLFLKVEACSLHSQFTDGSQLELLTKRLTRSHPSPYQSVVQFVSDVRTLFDNRSQNEAGDSLKDRFQEKLQQTLDSDVVALFSDVAEKSEGSNEKLKVLKRRLRTFLHLQTRKRTKMD